MTRAFTASLLAAALAASPLAAATQAARITMDAAKAKALAVVPHGRIKASELEREHGKLIYSFDIEVPGRTGVDEVQISAIDGRLVSHRHESAAKEKQEARDEAPSKGH